MLTPQEIADKKFDKVMVWGYDMNAVDSFLEAVEGDYSQLYKENIALKSKMKVLIAKIDEYRKVDESMRKTLLGAQTMASEIVERAKRESETRERQADEEVNRKLGELTGRIAAEEQRLEEAKTSAQAFIERVMSMYAREQENLTALRDREFAGYILQASAPAAQPASREDDILGVMQARQQDNRAQRARAAAAAAPAQQETIRITRPAAARPAAPQPAPVQAAPVQAAPVQAAPVQQPPAEAAPAAPAAEPAPAEDDILALMQARQLENRAQQARAAAAQSAPKAAEPAEPDEAPAAPAEPAPAPAETAEAPAKAADPLVDTVPLPDAAEVAAAAEVVGETVAEAAAEEIREVKEEVFETEPQEDPHHRAVPTPPPSTMEDEDGETIMLTPKPRFNFENLQFGDQYREEQEKKSE